jgi:hypothetical protein
MIIRIKDHRFNTEYLVDYTKVSISSEVYILKIYLRALTIEIRYDNESDLDTDIDALDRMISSLTTFAKI